MHLGASRPTPSAIGLKVGRGPAPRRCTIGFTCGSVGTCRPPHRPMIPLFNSIVATRTGCGSGGSPTTVGATCRRRRPRALWRACPSRALSQLALGSSDLRKAPAVLSQRSLRLFLRCSTATRLTPPERCLSAGVANPTPHSAQLASGHLLARSRQPSGAGHSCTPSFMPRYGKAARWSTGGQLPVTRRHQRARGPSLWPQVWRDFGYRDPGLMRCIARGRHPA
jgi:hypothetical protein